MVKQVKLNIAGTTGTGLPGLRHFVALCNPLADEVINDGLSLLPVAAASFNASNYIVVTAYDVPPGSTVAPDTGSPVMVAQYNGVSKSFTASTAEDMSAAYGISFPYTLPAGHSLQVIFAKVGSCTSPVLGVVGI